MADHDKFGVILDGILEGDEVALVELFKCAIDDGKALVRVGGGVAMTREMFKGGGDAILFKTLCESL